jgi:hypothetical protein
MAEPVTPMTNDELRRLGKRAQRAEKQWRSSRTARDDAARQAYIERLELAIACGASERGLQQEIATAALLKRSRLHQILNPPPKREKQ